MRRRQFVLGLVVLLVGWAHSWNVAIGHGNLLDFYDNDTKNHTVRTDSNKIGALIYDEVHNMVLYVDKQSGNDAICAYDISSLKNKCLIERNGKNIRGIAFDPATEILFFSDTYRKTINWFSLKPGYFNNVYGNLLLQIEHAIPTDIAVDSCRGYVYWINTNQTIPTIERAKLSGSDREVIINLEIILQPQRYPELEPHSLTIDQQTQRIYWIQATREAECIRYADLNGQNEHVYSCSPHSWNLPERKSNIMTVSKTSLIVLFQINSKTMLHKMTKNTYTKAKTTELTFKDETFGIVANYEIKDRIQDINNCEALTNIVQKNSDVPFCVHGEKIIGQSLCKCTPGYIGERCGISECMNYCFLGNCTLNNQGRPNCSCEEGYSGDRCQKDACYNFCLNGGKCSMSEAKETSCVCSTKYEGQRCEYNRSNTTNP